MLRVDEKWQGCVRNRKNKSRAGKDDEKNGGWRGGGERKRKPNQLKSLTKTNRSRQNTHTSSEGTGDCVDSPFVVFFEVSLTHRCLRLTRRRRLFLRVGVGREPPSPHLTLPSRTSFLHRSFRNPNTGGTSWSLNHPVEINFLPPGGGFKEDTCGCC